MTGRAPRGAKVAIEEMGGDLRGGDEQEAEARMARTVASYARAFPEVDPKALSAHLALIVTGNEVSDGVADHIARAGLDLRRPRYTLLRLLYLAPEKRLLQNEIAREMGVTPANVSQIIDALEQEDLVERVASAADRRSTYAKLTAKGEEACSRLVPAIVEFMAATGEALEPAELDQLLSLLGKVRAYLRERYGWNQD